MKKLWNWLLNKENRATIGFLLGIISGAVPALVAAYVYYNGDPWPEAPDRSDVCLVPKEEIPKFAHTTMHRHSAKIVKIAKSDMDSAFSVIGSTRDSLYSEFSDVRKFTIDIHFLQYLCNMIYTSDMSPRDMNKFRAMCLDAVIPEDTESLLQYADFEFSEDPQGIAGTWVGQYSYAYAGQYAELQPVDFHVRFVREEMRVFGAIFEPNSFSDNKETVIELFATLRGKIDQDSAIFFRKTYEGVDGVSHSIDYEGVYDPIGKTIRGTWRVPENPEWWGRFIMQKT